jgi:adducin
MPALRRFTPDLPPQEPPMNAVLKPFADPVQTPPGYREAEWQTRVDLALCYRLVHHYGWSSQVYNHITARIPGTEELLINPFGLGYDEITASNLIRIDIEGNKLDDSPFPVNAAGYCIHSAVHSARHDLQCVLHTHSENATAISAIDEGFIPVTQGGCMFHERVGYHEFEGIALDLEERERLVRDLGADNHTLVLANHGLLACGESISCAFARLYYFEENAGVQLKAMASGTLKTLSPNVMAKTRAQFEGGAAQAGSALPQPEWPAYYRMMDRIDPGWRH